MMLKYIIVTVLAKVCLAKLEQLSYPDPGRKDFDFLIFAQDWPISDCIQWETKTTKNECSIKSTQKWTIHGIWPARRDSLGPYYCDRNATFDETKIEPIIEDLKLEWTNDHANTGNDTLWKYEWMKHGTCAISLPALDDEFKYFSQGLTWHRQYPVFNYLKGFELLPGGVHPTSDIFEAVKTGLGGKNPMLRCGDVEGYEDLILVQIGICFDKRLELIDCDHVYDQGLFGKCMREGTVLYPRDERSFKVIEKVSIGLGIVVAASLVFWAIGMTRKAIIHFKNRNVPDRQPLLPEEGEVGEHQAE